MRARSGLFALASALVSVAPRAAASPELDFGFGARSQALAGAGTAIADDSAAVFQNPSGLARAERVTVTLGYANVSYALSDNGSAASLRTVNALEGGLVVPGAIRGMPVAFGLSLALPDGKLSRLRQADSTLRRAENGAQSSGGDHTGSPVPKQKAEAFVWAKVFRSG